MWRSLTPARAPVHVDLESRAAPPLGSGGRLPPLGWGRGGKTMFLPPLKISRYSMKNTYVPKMTTAKNRNTILAGGRYLFEGVSRLATEKDSCRKNTRLTIILLYMAVTPKDYWGQTRGDARSTEGYCHLKHVWRGGQAGLSLSDCLRFVPHPSALLRHYNYYNN